MMIRYKKLIVIPLIVILVFFIWYNFFTSLNVKINESNFSRICIGFKVINDYDSAKKFTDNLNSLKVVKHEPKTEDMSGRTPDVSIDFVDKSGKSYCRLGVYGSYIQNMDTLESYSLKLNKEIADDFYHEKLMAKLLGGEK